VLLDDEEVNMFGGPGGYIYITRGFLNFIESESELAAALAHEVAHIASHQYSNIPKYDKMKKVYEGLLKGSELAKDAIGTYGTAANQGLKYLGRAAPHVARRFGHDEEIVADQKTVEYLMAAGYDPRGLHLLMDRLARINMDDVGRFVNFMNTHPPFPDRRKLVQEKLGQIDFTKGDIEFNKDTLNEVRQITINAPDSIIFEPELGVHRLTPNEVEDNLEKNVQKVPAKRRVAWF
jgi:predicted Zn-dependent protease